MNTDSKTTNIIENTLNQSTRREESKLEIMNPTTAKMNRTI